jgi:hypothetical protein
MLTDAPPRKRNRDAFADSDRHNILPVPTDDRLKRSAQLIESAMKKGMTRDLQRASAEFLRVASNFYRVPECRLRVLAVRPRQVRESSISELFGDYHPGTLVVRVWKRTAVRKELTSFGTFLSTLCHEFCHHLDFHRFRFRNSWHTRGFYERTALLYHHARGTPPKKLVWLPVPGRRWRVDWSRMKSG